MAMLSVLPRGSFKNISSEAHQRPEEANHGSGHRSKPIMPLACARRSTEKHEKTSLTRRETETLVADRSAAAAAAAARASAPLLQALRASAEENVACFHFPGHNRGKAAPPLLSQLVGPAALAHDLSTIPEIDYLFSPKGVILEAQKKAAELFGSTETWFLVGGTTCGIQASIMATCCPGDTLILPRNSHMSAVSGMVLSGAAAKYVIPEYNSGWDIPGGITPTQVENAIIESIEAGKKVAAVLVVSPTYQGICSDVREIARVCHSRGVPVIVDEAHGAHFRFHPELPSTALEQGADVAVQSTHKVLGSLTQSSMLHLSGRLVDRDRVSRCLQALQSSSPSYLLLASLDAARAQLSDNPVTLFDEAIDLAVEARNQISKIPGSSVLDLSTFASAFPCMDPLRLTLGTWQLHLSGFMADQIMREELKIYSELVGSKSLTFAMNLGTSREDIQRLVSGMKHLSATFFQEKFLVNGIGVGDRSPFSDIMVRLSARDAFFSKKRKVRVQESIGEVCGELFCPYPPGIPVLVPGEVITEGALFYLLDAKRMGAAIRGAADKQFNSIVVCDV